MTQDQNEQVHERCGEVEFMRTLPVRRESIQGKGIPHVCGGQAEVGECLGEAEAAAEIIGELRDAFAGGSGHRRALLSARFLKDDPEAGPENTLCWTDGTSELDKGQVRAFGRDNQRSPRVVYQVAEALRDQDFVDLPWRGFLDLGEIIIRQRERDRQFHGHSRCIGVWCDANAHRCDARQVFCYAFGAKAHGREYYGWKSTDSGYGSSFRVRMTGENGEGAIDLFGKNDARQFVWHGEGRERNRFFSTRTE